jgi:hypothetical protein
MRTLAALLTLLLVAIGCATDRRPVASTHSDPVDVVLSGLSSTNGHSVATFLVTNVSTEPFWLDAASNGEPIFWLQWKGHFCDLERPMNEQCIGAARLLAAGHSQSFQVVLRPGVDASEPFRIGVRGWPHLSEAAPLVFYWSKYESPWY